jgi:hypothetical protein
MKSFFLRRAGMIALCAASLSCIRAAVPDYKLGDVATEDVVTPVPLLVVNPEATEALKQRVAQQVPFIVRVATQNTADAEAALRESIATGRGTFEAALQRVLGRRATATDVGTPAFVEAMQALARELPQDFPIDKLALLWVSGVSDEAFIETLLKPIREVMAQPVTAAKSDTPIPSNQQVRLLPVKTESDTPTREQLESAGPTISPGKVIGLWRARRLVETYFPLGQEGMGRFAATFVRANAFPDAALTGILKARRLEGLTVNDTYETATVIVHQGQTIDRKAFAALAAMREKSLIGTLQSRLEQEQSVAGQIGMQTRWIGAGLGAVVVALLVILWRLRSRPSTALVAAAMNHSALVEGNQQALPAGENDAAWQTRAMLAEAKAERAHDAIRQGVLGWMREKIVQTLFRHRAELLSVQRKAEAEMRELEQRLEQLQTPLQERIAAYEKRIEELEKDLAAKGEENRELIGARITVARQQLNMERERGSFGTN